MEVLVITLGLSDDLALFKLSQVAHWGQYGSSCVVTLDLPGGMINHVAPEAYLQGLLRRFSEKKLS